jgi:3',5'-cyclic-AMP phosphodiesterase
MLHVQPDSFHEIGTISYRDRLRSGAIGRKAVPVLRATLDGLPAGLPGIVALGDLQGSGGNASAPRLPTFDAIDELNRLAANGTIPALREMIAVTVGDLFAHLDSHKRGGGGDVRGCWRALRAQFRAVVGVAGNHDRFGDIDAEYNAFRAEDEIHLLDTESVVVAGLRFAGICGVIGNVRREFRHAEDDFHAAIDLLVQSRPDFLLLHEGPVTSADPARTANAGIRERCARLNTGVVICGHNQTVHPLQHLASRTQVLSAHERVIVLTHL